MLSPRWGEHLIKRPPLIRPGPTERGLSGRAGVRVKPEDIPPETDQTHGDHRSARELGLSESQVPRRFTTKGVFHSVPVIVSNTDCFVLPPHDFSFALLFHS